MTDDLEGRSLDEALARAMGREVKPWHQNYEMALPLWHASLDALRRDVDPVCRERGMLWLSIEQAGENLWNAFAKMRSGMSQYEDRTTQATVLARPLYEHGAGPTAATALARAFLAVLTRGER